jgi:ketose-bisphosphate aldolase
MPLVSISELVAHARHHHYAIGYFESWGLDSLEGVVDAAEMSRSPVIMGFNGEFLSHPQRTMHERLAWYGALGKAAATSAKVPCGFIFNECSDDSWVRQAVTAGFNLVMPVPAEDESEQSYTERVRAITDYAHGQGVAVEAEIGTLPFGADDLQADSEVTDPERAKTFVEATGIDLLAVSVGNVHVLLEGHRPLHLERLAALRHVISTGFVLHGGTGISDDSLKAAIDLGVVKVNYGTVLKQRYLAALRHGLATTNPNPHDLLGYGGETDLLVMGRLAVRDAVLEKMRVLGCIGRG